MKNIRASVAVACLWLAAVSSASAQVNNDAYRDYFLFGRFGEVCTMCEVTVLCQAAVTDTVAGVLEIPEAGSFTVYHLQTRSFWSQISTIWEWFIANFSSASLAARGHTRPVLVYDVADGEWSGPEVVEARLLLEPPLLEFGARHIDRVSRAWRDSESGDMHGYCTRLPLWDALAVIDRQTGLE